jgi:hypothetical protein
MWNEGQGTALPLTVASPRPSLSQLRKQLVQPKKSKISSVKSPVRINRSGETKAHRATPSQWLESEEVQNQKVRSRLLRISVNRKFRQQQQRKERIALPVKDTMRGRNLGVVAKGMTQLTKQHVNSLLRSFKQCLKKKDDRSYAMMCRLSTLLVGSIFRTEYVYRECAPYCGHSSGYVRIMGKPSFAATRLIIEQILQCKSNAPIRLIERLLTSS